jgi:methionyl-tRNA synthetase
LENLFNGFKPGYVLAPYSPLAVRLDIKNVENMMQEEKDAVAAIAAEKKSEDVKTKGSKENSQKTSNTESIESSDAGTAGIITIDDLTKVELRVGRILSAEVVEGADKLLRISLDLGEEKSRHVIAGIKAAYAPEDLKDLLVVAVANLAPRKMKFGISEAMLLAAGEGDKLSLFTPHRSAVPGDRLR